MDVSQLGSGAASVKAPGHQVVNLIDSDDDSDLADALLAVGEARQEALLELVGHMGEADGQAVLGRQHGRFPFCCFNPSTSRH